MRIILYFYDPCEASKVTKVKRRKKEKEAIEPVSWSGLGLAERCQAGLIDSGQYERLG